MFNSFNAFFPFPKNIPLFCFFLIQTDLEMLSNRSVLMQEQLQNFYQNPSCQPVFFNRRVMSDFKQVVGLVPKDHCLSFVSRIVAFMLKNIDTNLF
jgi:hypothetical protein